MAAAGFDQWQSVNLAILDGGFWLDSAGHPLEGSTDIGTDLPYTPVQYDFVLMTISLMAQMVRSAVGAIPVHGMAMERQV